MTFQRGDTLSVGWRHKRGYPHLGWLHERGIPPDVGWCHERRDTRWWKSSVLQNRKWLLINYVELTFAVILYNSLLFSFYAKEKRKAHCKLDDRSCQKLGRYPLMTSSLEYLKRRLSLLRSRDVFVQPLRQDFLFQKSSEEAPRVHSSSIYQLFLTSMQQPMSASAHSSSSTFYQSRGASAWFTRRFTSMSACLNG